MKQSSFQKVLVWLDNNILFVLACFLTIFIPTYPKLPLFDIIPGYIVRVRIEDFVVLFTGVIWVVQLLRKKITWKTPLTWIIGAYAITGILSTLSALFLIDTVPVEFLHAGKTALHFFRYMEYFFLFFLLIEAVRTAFNTKILFRIFLISVIAISIYGYGQRYFFWPVYSTMNREFSKGETLYLTEHARVQSTFGGHYDLGAYLVLTLPILLSAIYIFKKKWQKVLLAIVFLMGMWLLIETASRASFAGFLAACYIVIGIYALRQSKWWKKVLFFIKDCALLSFAMMILVFQFGDDIYDRFLQLVQPYPIIMDNVNYISEEKKLIAENGIKAVFTEAQLTSISEFFHVAPPEHGVAAVTTETGATVVDDSNVIADSDTRPSTTRPADVFTDVPVTEMVATTSADGTVTMQLQEKPREFSQCAEKYGLSACIRYETLWPRAIAGFEKNPLLGSGYATLTKESEYQFTEAESTDNNFLRTLGETGLLGFITFYGAIILAMRIAWKVMKEKGVDDYAFIFASSFIGGAIGLFVNASYIDVFAASKVAFTLWTLAGIVCGSYVYLEKQKNNTVKVASAAAVPPVVSHKKNKAVRKK